MQTVRIYTGDDGESHFEDIELDHGDDPRGFLITKLMRSSAVQFYHLPPGHFSDWHTGDRHQFVITLEGQVEIGLGDGTKRRFNPGDIELIEDLNGRGHTSQVVSDVPRVMVAIVLDEEVVK